MLALPAWRRVPIPGFSGPTIVSGWHNWDAETRAEAIQWSLTFFALDFPCVRK